MQLCVHACNSQLSLRTADPNTAAAFLIPSSLNIHNVFQKLESASPPRGRYLKDCNYTMDGRFASEPGTHSNETLFYNNMPKHDFWQTQIICDFNSQMPQIIVIKLTQEASVDYTK